MSVALTTMVWRLQAMQTSLKLTLLALCDHAADDGLCWPSIAKLSEFTGISERQVKRLVHALIRQRYISVVGNDKGGQPGHSRRYQINLDSLATGDICDTRETGRVTNDAGTGDKPDMGGVTNEAQTGVTGVTLTIIEPSIEPPRSNHQGAKSKFVLPEWIAADVWKNWCDYRRVKGGWTDRAKQLSIGSLEKLRAQGYEPQAVIDNAIELGWSGLYPPKSFTQRAPPTGRPSVADTFTGIKTYTGTPENELPSFLRADAA